MSRQVIATLLSRCGIPDSGVGLTQFFADGDDYTAAHVGGVAGRPAADDHAAAPLARARSSASSSDR